jgi:hypothetical protein
VIAFMVQRILVGQTQPAVLDFGAFSAQWATDDLDLKSLYGLRLAGASSTWPVSITRTTRASTVCESPAALARDVGLA